MAQVLLRLAWHLRQTAQGFRTHTTSPYKTTRSLQPQHPTQPLLSHCGHQPSVTEDFLLRRYQVVLWLCGYVCLKETAHSAIQLEDILDATGTCAVCQHHVESISCHSCVSLIRTAYTKRVHVIVLAVQHLDHFQAQSLVGQGWSSGTTSKHKTRHMSDMNKKPTTRCPVLYILDEDQRRFQLDVSFRMTHKNGVRGTFVPAAKPCSTEIRTGEATHVEVCGGAWKLIAELIVCFAHLPALEHACANFVKFPRKVHIWVPGLFCYTALHIGENALLR